MVLLYIITLFASAALLFVVQPMVGKMVLPLLGGTPAVWTTCMVFFQAALLGGYAYAHASAAWMGGRWQAMLHLTLLVAALFVLPITLASGINPPAQDYPVFWLLGRLALTVGLPFFVVAGTSPLLQKWFAGSRHRHAHDPYFLYAASNAGSLLALLSYPIVIEPLLDLQGQAQIWRAGYYGLIALVLACVFAPWRRGDVSSSARRDPLVPTADPATALTWRQRTWWVALAAVPSSLMLGVTLHITTNVAAMPLLWVLPLSLYLLTFVLAFARRQVIPADLVSRLLPAVALLMGPLFFVTLPALEWRLTVAHLALFFMAAFVCHVRLASIRPEPRHLTEYYLWIALGGVLGGMFNALVAPLVFRTVIEYPLMVVAACLLRPGPTGTTAPTRTRRLDWLLPAGLAIVALAAAVSLNASAWKGWAGLALLFLLVTAVNITFWRRPARFALGYAAALVAFGLYARLDEGDLLHVERNFFGVKKVVSVRQGQFHVLYHGTTVHGIECMDGAHAGEPLAYYHRAGPVGEVFQLIAQQGNGADVAAIGLGAGTIASYAKPGQTFDFYEIDPGVARIAMDPRYFRYLSQSPGICTLILGDGRLALASASRGRYGLIFLDAYSSDAVPTHLLSREAVQLYLDRLQPHGLLMFHITNRFMNLEPIVASLARDAELVGRVWAQKPDELTADQQASGCTPAQVAVLARRIEDLGVLAQSAHWRPLVGDPLRRVWTDQYSDVLSPLLGRLLNPP